MLLQPRHYLEQFHKKYADPAKLDAAIKEGKFETWMQLFNNKWGISWDYMRAKTIPLPKLSPWILKESNDQRTVLERNPYYFKVDAAGNQMPYIDKIEFTTVADPEVLAVKQFAGETDYGCEVVTMPKIALYKQNETKGNYNLKFGNIHRTAGAIFLNMTYKDETWRKVVQDIRFRQALNMAINRKEVIDAVYYGYAEPTDLVPNKFDEAGAMKLLDAMGMDKKDADGFRLGPDGKTFTILIEPHNDFWDHGPVAQLAAQFWNKVGIKTTMKPLTGALWGPKVNANELQATVLFDVSTLWYYQAYGLDLWGSLWNTWRTTGGKQGEEPPQAVKDLVQQDCDASWMWRRPKARRSPKNARRRSSTTCGTSRSASTTSSRASRTRSSAMSAPTSWRSRSHRRCPWSSASTKHNPTWTSRFRPGCSLARTEVGVPSTRKSDMQQMTELERFHACMEYQPVDHVPFWDWGAWPETDRTLAG